MVKYILSDNATYTANENQKILNRDVAPTVTTREGNTRAALSTYLSDKFPINYNAEELTIKIKNCTKQGYLEAMAGDGCYISNIDKKRGTV